MNRDFDWRLQLVLKPHDDYDFLISKAVEGGVTCVQWRDKKLSDREFFNKALEIQRICRRNQVPLIINDRVHVALAIGADVVHLGQNDLPFKAARQLLPKSIQIGLSAESFQDVEEAQNFDLDYLAISPVFDTPSKLDTKPAFGLDGLKRAREISRHTLVAIGGINSSNAREIYEAGADGLAVVSAICDANDPCKAAKKLCGRY